MDETGTSIVAQVAAKCATEQVKGQSYAEAHEEWGRWFAFICAKVISGVRAMHPEGAQTTSAAPTTASNGSTAPLCPQHGLMLPGPAQRGKGGPEWKCNQSKWDFNAKQEIGCPYVLWPADA